MVVDIGVNESGQLTNSDHKAFYQQQQQQQQPK
jgi:hypothetical protein